MLYAIFDEKRRAEIRLALAKGREIEFRKAKPLPEGLQWRRLPDSGLGRTQELRGFGYLQNPIMG